MDLLDQLESSSSGAWTAQDLSPFLKCSDKFLYKMVAAGTIPYFRIGSLVRFWPAEIAAWLRTRRGGKMFVRPVSPGNLQVRDTHPAPQKLPPSKTDQFHSPASRAQRMGKDEKSREGRND